jgi:hypothetical protein
MSTSIPPQSKHTFRRPALATVLSGSALVISTVALGLTVLTRSYQNATFDMIEEVLEANDLIMVK